jgi:hypothetical protein
MNETYLKVHIFLVMRTSLMVLTAPAVLDSKNHVAWLHDIIFWPLAHHCLRKHVGLVGTEWGVSHTARSLACNGRVRGLHITLAVTERFNVANSVIGGTEGACRLATGKHGRRRKLPRNPLEVQHSILHEKQK